MQTELNCANDSVNCNVVDSHMLDSFVSHSNCGLYSASLVESYL